MLKNMKVKKNMYKFEKQTLWVTTTTTAKQDSTMATNFDFRIQIVVNGRRWAVKCAV